MAPSTTRGILFLAMLAAGASAASCQKQTPAAASPSGETRITGTVIDAQTGKPIENFLVIPGSTGGNYRRRIRREVASTFTGGHFQTDLDHKISNGFLWIEAPGHLPFISPVIGDKESQRTLNVQLQPADPITGTVVSPAGQPLQGASVLLASPFESVQFFNGIYTEKEAAPGAVWTHTDDGGHFSLPPRDGKFKVAIASDEGLAVVTGEELSANHTIAIKPWGKIDGVLMQGDKPWAGAKVGMDWKADYVEGEPSVDFWYDSATTDKDGHFSFPRVHACTTNINVLPQTADTDDETLITYGPVKVQLGQTAQVRYGDQGRPVTGIIDLSAFGDPSKLELLDSSFCRAGPPIALPENWRTMSSREKETWYNEWEKKKEASPAAAEEEYQCYTIDIDSQGRYQLPAVGPGMYLVRVQVYEKGKAPGEWGEHIGRGMDVVIVPETAGWSSQAMIPQPLKPDTLSVLRIGDLAPATPFEKPDGTRASLADFRGMVVVVDVWATWCGPCIAAVPDLKLTQQEFADNANVEILSLSLDDDKSAWTGYVAKEKLPWTQGYIGPWRSDGIGPPDGKIPDAWGVHAIPAMFVVDKSGKVVFKGRQGREMRAAIRAAL